MGVEWFVNSNGQEMHMADDKLFLYNVRKEDSSLYFCRGFDSHTRVFQIPVTLFVDTQIVLSGNII